MMFYINKEAVKQSFEKVKQDIYYLNNEIQSLKLEIIDIKSYLKSLDESLSYLKLKAITIPTDNPTDSQKSPSDSSNPTHIPTHPVEIGGLKYPNLDTSSGNEGVPTDRQTDSQTGNPTQISSSKDFNKPLDESILEASTILDSLDSIKKQIRLKFKSLTNQELLVFSTIYQLEDQGILDIDYLLISKKLGLSQSSIRDYTQKLISKGVSIRKTKLNNKKIILSISPELKKLASLRTILRLREI